MKKTKAERKKKDSLKIRKPEAPKEAPVTRVAPIEAPPKEQEVKPPQQRNLLVQTDGTNVNISVQEVTNLELRTIGELLHNVAMQRISGKEATA